MPHSEAELLLAQVYTYVWDCWFRPYRSEIAWRQSLIKFVVPKPLKLLPPITCSSAMVDKVKQLHANFCAGAERTRSFRASLDDEQDKAMQARDWKHYSIPIVPRGRPVIRTSSWDFQITHPWDIRVVVMPNGVDTGLSASMDLSLVSEAERLDIVCDGTGRLQAVETTLRSATQFLMALEQREADIFGSTPDPHASPCDVTESPSYRSAQRAGVLWNSNTMGPLHTPTSAWIDVHKYATWTGPGLEQREAFERRFDFYWADASLQREFRARGRPECLIRITQPSNPAVLDGSRGKQAGDASTQ